MPCRDRRNNKQETLDRMYHDSETFLYRYRWWIVLLLAVLLAYYLYTRRCETETIVSPVGERTVMVTGGPEPMLGGALNFGDPISNINTEGRKLFRL